MNYGNILGRKRLCGWLAALGLIVTQSGVGQAGEFFKLRFDDSCGGDCGASSCESGSGCNSCDVCECNECGCDDGHSCCLFGGGGDSGIDFGGWTQWGYHDENNGMFNSRPHQFANHQSWIYAEKVADGSEGVDWGFRGDLMYGLDADDTQAFGNNPGEWDFANGFDHGAYGWAIPQLYAEVAMGDLSIIAGHFYTLLGYEVVTAPDNFFYSHAYTMYNSEAFTHTGVLATYAASDDVTLYGGWTLGWDTGFDQFGSGSSFLGGAGLGLSDDATLTYITTIGDFGAIGEGYSHSMVLDLVLTDDLNYVIQSDYLDVRNTPGAVAGQDYGSSYGLNQYLLYSISDQLGVGGRMEWWKARDVVNGGWVSQYALTGGVNIKPTDNLIIRPEIRHDWAPAGSLIQPQGRGDYTTFGADAILTF